MKGKNKVILGSALAIAMSASMIAGSTFALFTSESTVNIAVTSGKVSVKATIGELTVESLNGYSATGATSVALPNGGTASVDGQSVKLDGITSGDVVSFDINVDNSSTTVNAKYRASYVVESGYLLADGLDISVNEVQGKYKSYASAWSEEVSSVYNVTIALPDTGSKIDNLYQNLTTSISFKVEAIQANGVVGGEEEFELLPDYTEIKEAFLNDPQSIAFVNSEISLENAVANGGYIVLNGDIETSSQTIKEQKYDHKFYKIVTDTVIDLNGYTYVGGFQTYKNDHNPVTVKVANGTIHAEGNYLNRAFQGSGYNFTTIFENLDIDNGIYVAYVGWGDTLIIESGVYAATGSADEKYGNNFLLNLYDKDPGTILVRGGTYKNYNPACSKSENPTGNFVDEGYSVVFQTVGSDTWYTVVAEEEVQSYVGNGYTLYVAE